MRWPCPRNGSASPHRARVTSSMSGILPKTVPPTMVTSTASLAVPSAASPPRVSQWDSYIHPDDLPVLQQAIQQHLKVHTPLRIAYRMHCTDGTWRTIVESSQAVLDKDGHVVKWVGTTADITERLHLENELQRMDKLE